MRSSPAQGITDLWSVQSAVNQIQVSLAAFTLCNGQKRQLNIAHTSGN